MKAIFVVLSAVLVVASAGLVSIPSALNLGYSTPFAAPYAAPYAASYAAPYAAPYDASYAAPYAGLGYNYGLSAPLTYVASPVAYTAPAIQSGYVAATRGSVHTAPLPEGPLAFSHHINTAPAPGTL